MTDPSRATERDSRPDPTSHGQLSTPEFVALIALTISLVAMSIDSMLPALGTIASDLGAKHENDRQLVLTLFFAGITIGQIFYGPLADALGRRRAIFAGMAVLALGTSICLFATSFPMMLAGRVISGIGSAGPRIVAIAVVRDLYGGRRMARIMSFVSATFILVPIVAPSAGQGILLFASWRAIFGVLVSMTAFVALWFGIRQKETLPVERRRPLSLGPVGAAIAEVVKTAQTLRYTIAAGLVFAALIAYLATAQQIFGDVYALGKAFPLCFGALAASLGAASLLNGRLVMRFGMVKLSGLALVISTSVSGAFLGYVLLMHGHPPFWAFMGYMLVVFFCNGLLFGNFNALAIDPLGHIAGAAAAVIGSLTSLISTVVGTPVGRLFDGTVTPLVAGFFAMTLGALLVTRVGAPVIDDSDKQAAAH